jgi:hypothetical protein
MGPTRVLGKKGVLHHLAERVIDREMQFLDSGHFRGRSLDSYIRECGQYSAVLTGEAENFKTQCPGGFGSPYDIFGIPGCTDSHQHISGLAKGDHLLSKSVFGLVVVVECGVKPDHGGKGECGQSAMKFL